MADTSPALKTWLKSARATIDAVTLLTELCDEKKSPWVPARVRRRAVKILLDFPPGVSYSLVFKFNTQRDPVPAATWTKD